MDRLEYIMWRDTIRYKYQLDKSLQLSDQEIEEKIDELERTIGESMPYYFDGKDDENIRTVVNHNMGFSGNNGIFVATQDDYRKWEEEESVLLFCGNAGLDFLHTFHIQQSDNITEPSKEDLRTIRREGLEIISQFKGLNEYPLQTFKSIIEKFRKIKYYNTIDFTNLESVKEIFRQNQIYTYREFHEQNGYITYSNSEFKLPDGSKVIVFQYQKIGFKRYEEYEDEIFDE